MHLRNSLRLGITSKSHSPPATKRALAQRLPGKDFARGGSMPCRSEVRAQIVRSDHHVAYTLRKEPRALGSDEVRCRRARIDSLLPIRMASRLRTWRLRAESRI